MVSRNRKIARRIGKAVANDVLDISGAISAGAGVTVYATADDLPTTGLTAGDEAFVSGSNRLYISNGTGWYSIGLVNTNPAITSVEDPSNNTTPFTLATDGSALVLTITAADPEDIPLTYSYAVTTGSLTNGGGTTATVVQGTGANINQFTITPSSTEAYAGTFELTFTTSDGINQASSVNSFTLEFITIITDSKYTTLLATAVDTSDNNNITDTSSNNHTITVNGDAHAGTFSPYRSGGYSTYFDGTGDWLELTGTALGNGNFTVEAWVWLDSLKDYNVIYDDRATGSSATGLALGVMATGAPYLYTNNGFQITSSQTCTAKTWHHISLVRSSGVITIYLDGTSGGTYSSSANFTDTNLGIGVARTYTVTSQFGGYIRDVRAVVGSAITPPSGGPTERLEAVATTSLLTCHLPYFADGSSNDHSITINGDPEIKPFSPYDYEEYSETDHGGSVYFDVDGDWITATGIDLSSARTIEFWYYKSTNSTALETIFSIGNGYTDNVGVSLFTRSGDFEFRVGSSIVYDSGASLDLLNFTWHHIAIVISSSNSADLYINGSRKYSGSNVTRSNSMPISIGSSVNGLTWNNTIEMQGFISDFAIFNSAKYSGTTLTIPTSPLSSSGSELHIKGTDASIIDKSQSANLKLVGNTTGSTTQVKFSNTKSMYFDGTGDEINAGRSIIPVGFSDFTVEGWVNFSNLSGQQFICIQAPNGTTTTTTFMIYLANSKIYNQWGSGSAYIETGILSANTWYHFASVHDSANSLVYFYLDGSSVGSFSSGLRSIGDYVFDIGARDSALFLNGYLQDLRVSSYARYTTNFTPPTASLEG